MPSTAYGARWAATHPGRHRMGPLGVLLFELLALLAVAQVARSEAVFDGSIGPNPDGAVRSGDFTIDQADGEASGANLYHSFRIFDVDVGESATFNSDPTIQRIITRVTGDAAAGNTGSTISGPLTTSPGVSLYLLNPMGVLFTEGAQVDVSGSVFLTTADGLVFDDASGASVFRVDDPSPPLSSGTPSSFLIDAGGTGVVEFRGAPGSLPGSFTPFDFGAEADVTIIASDVRFDAAGLVSRAGTVRVAAVGSGGAQVPVDVSSWTPSIGAGEIEFVDDSIVCVDQTLCFGGAAEFPDRGRIVIRGGRLTLDQSKLVAGGDGQEPWAVDVETDGEILMSGNRSLIGSLGDGDEAVGGVRLSSGRIEVSDTLPDGLFSGIRHSSGASSAPLLFEAHEVVIESAAAQTFATGDGEGAGIQIEAHSVAIGDSSLVFTTSEGVASGNAGEIAIETGDAGAIVVSDGSLVGSTTVGVGGSGSVSLSGSTISISNASQVRTDSISASTGPIGGITLDAGPDGSISVTQGADVSSVANGTGRGGDIMLTGGQIEITDGAEIRTESGTTATGDAGTIFVTGGASGSLRLDGASTLAATTLGQGNAGRVIDGRRLGVRIETGSVSASGGSQIFSTTDGAGDAGNVELALADTLTLSGAAAATPSGVFSQSGPDESSAATGDGGEIIVSARSMSVLDGAGVGVTTNGAGAAGSITVDVDETFTVDGLDSFMTAEGNVGPAGEIRVDARDVRVTDGALVSATSLLSGDAGNISMNAAETLVVDGGSINTNLRGVGSDASGGGIELTGTRLIAIRNGGIVSTDGASVEPSGDIQLSSAGQIEIESGARVSAAASGAGNSGKIDIESSEFRLTDAAVVTDATRSAGGQISISTTADLQVDQGRIETRVTTQGDGSGGDVALSGERVLLNRAEVRAGAITGFGGNIDIRGSGVLISSDTILDASTELGIDGRIFISAADTNLIERVQVLPETMLTASSQLAAQCAARDPHAKSSFVVGRRDATPPTPDRWLGPTVAGTRQGGARPGALPPEVEAALRAGHRARAADLLDASLAGVGPSAEHLTWLRALTDIREALGQQRVASDHRDTAAAWAATLDDPTLVILTEADREAARSKKRATEGQLEQLDALAMKSALPHEAQARVHLQRGWAAQQLGRTPEALDALAQSASAASDADLPIAAARALALAARIQSDLDDPASAMRSWNEAATAIADAPPSAELAETRLHLAETARMLARHHAGSRQWAYVQLMAAKSEAEALGDPRSAAAAWSGLARIYEDEDRAEESLQLAREAARLARKANAPELIYVAEWQSARALGQMDRPTESIAAYNRSLDQLEGLRFEAPPPNRAFRRDIAAVHYGLVDQLLRSEQRGVGSDSQHRYRRVRDVIETSKASELRDYFDDPCIDALVASEQSVDDVSHGALIVYPIVLPDRLELLVTLPDGDLERVTVPVTQAEIEADVRQLRRLLTKRTTRQYLKPARSLYDDLVRPLEPYLDDPSIETIVFVPDGALRTIPMAALHDGERFLVERWSVGVAPSMAMTAPRAIPTGTMRALIGGLTESRLDFAPLENVQAEVDAISNEIGGDVLLDEAFSTAGIETRIREGDYGIVHFATHAVFEGADSESFMLTSDGRLAVDDLELLIGRFQYREEPLELLGLSACETAAGDDRAALGLSGIAVRAGARSVLGTLWSVDDKATSDLIARFYRELNQDGVSRAEALRRAQHAAISDASSTHPYYWAPFIIINSWL